MAHLKIVGACLLTPLGKRLVQRLNEHLVILLLLLDHLQVRQGQLLKLDYTPVSNNKDGQQVNAPL